MSTFLGVGVEYGHLVPYSESLGLRVVGLVQPFLGVCNSLQVSIPKAHSLAEALVFTVSLGLGSGKVRKTLEGQASPLRLAWERMTLMSPSLQSHCKACFQKSFLGNSDFLSDILERGVL